MSPQPKSQPDTALPSGRNTGGQIAAMVLKYFTERPGTVVYRPEIAEATGLPEEKIRVAVANLRLADKLGAKDALEVVIAGQAWRWLPHGIVAPAIKPAKRIFEELAVTKNGDLIIQDADTGALFRATELE